MIKVSRPYVAWVLAKRELMSTLYGVGFYITIFATTLVAGFMLRNYLGSVGQVGMLITASPLDMPFFIAVVVCSIYLALASATSIAREKDLQTIEILFYGPVDSISFILGKYIKGILGYLVVAVFLVFYFALTSGLANLGLAGRFWQTFLLSLFLVSCIVSFGILFSALTNGVRSSLLLFLGATGLLLAIQLAHRFLIGLSSDTLSQPIVYIRNGISIIALIVRWVSPFYYFSEGIDAISLGSGTKYLVSSASSVVYSVVLLALSVAILRAKGIRGVREE
jgi:ABC-type transport system involved in multi-copper enzyme maturation permease subunit